MTSMRRTTRRTTSKTTRETREKSKKEQTVRVRKKYLHATRHVCIPCVDEKIILKKRFICVFFDRFQGYESHGGLFVLKGVPFPLVEAQLLV